MKYIYFILLFIVSCAPTPDQKAYRLETVRESFSVISNRMERETIIDTFYAADDTAAFDTVSINIYGQQEAQRALRAAYRNNNSEYQYKFVAQKIISLTAYNPSGHDIRLLLPDTVLAKSYRKYKVEPLGHLDKNY